jgi:chromatin remodeling complex protein RSC6
MAKKLTVKYLAMRVALLENIINQYIINGDTGQGLYADAQAAFGPVLDSTKVIKMIKEQEKENTKKVRKAEKKEMAKAQAKTEKLEKGLKKAEKKIAKMTKEKTPKNKKYNMPPVDLAPPGHPGHDTI